MRRIQPLTGTGNVFWWPLWFATLAGFCCVPLALTYNSLTILLDLLGLTIVMALTTPIGRSSSFQSRYLSTGFLALIIFLLYLAKPPAVIAFVACIGVLFFCSPELRPWQRRLLVWIYMLCTVFGLVIVVVVATRSGFSKDRLFNVNGIVFSPSWILENLRRYWDEIARILPSVGRDLLWSAGPTIFMCALAVSVRRDVLLANSLMPVGLFLLVAACAGASARQRLWDGSFAAAVSGEAARFYLLLFCSLLPLWIICLIRLGSTMPCISRQQVAWIIVLLALPIISSFGSTNTVYVSALHERVLWVAGLVLLAGQIGGMLGVPWFEYSVAALISVVAAGQLFTGHFLRPYMHQPSLWHQTESIDVGFPATTLKVDPQVAQFLRYVREKLDGNGYKSGDDVFGFFNLPGVIYAIGGKEPGAPWYFGTWYHQDDTDSAKLRRVPLGRRHGAWIITQADVSSFRPQFLDSGIDFPNGYKKIGQTINPTTGLEIGIWKPIARH